MKRYVFRVSVLLAVDHPKGWNTHAEKSVHVIAHDVMSACEAASQYFQNTMQEAWTRGPSGAIERQNFPAMVGSFLAVRNMMEIHAESRLHVVSEISTSDV